MRDTTLQGVSRQSDTGSLQTLDSVGLDVRGKTLLKEISFTVPKAGVTAVLGANGAGKTTLLKLMHGLLQPSSGKMLWEGEPLETASHALQAMVFQTPVMLRRSVYGNVSFALKAKGLRGKALRLATEEALFLANLETETKRPARTLSKGEQQRLAIARAVALSPQMLLLDEPTASLDPAATHAIETMIAEARSQGITILLVTHDLGQARRLSDTIVYLCNGRLTETGPSARCLYAPQSAPLAAWIEGNLYLGGGAE